MKILVTGAAGFIGFHFINSIKNKKIKIYGIDNLNDYYSTKLKKDRLKYLKKNKNFYFYKIDISNFSSLKKIFKNKFDIVYNFAAQAGVRYSFQNPKQYLESNVVGFFNILELSRITGIKRIFYASSSSVYGDSSSFPINEKSNLNPKNFYALSKKNNEEIAEIYAKKYNINLIGLRFFTVFGEWGRPDMFMMKYLESSKKNKIFRLNNFGNHIRDFTYIKDAISIIKKLKFSSRHEIYNICSNRPVTLKYSIKLMNNFIKKPRTIKVGFQEGDAIKTHGDNRKILRKIKGYKFTSFDSAVKKTIFWYLNYKK
tara:strand:+ start:110 stop:1048 length:939 start_codon:yes stop_codon:yes gene_type:complete